MLDEQQIDAEPGQFALLDTEGRQPEGFGRGKEHAARMGLECQHARRAACFPREIAGPADQHGMAAVQAIEIADREDRAGGVVRPRAGMSYDSDHGSGNRAVSRAANCHENSPTGGPRIADRVALTAHSAKAGIIEGAFLPEDDQPPNGLISPGWTIS